MVALVVMGVSGSGKSTIAQQIVDLTGWPFAEADEFHPPANVAKMSRGEPLNDDDRWPWLRALRDWMGAHIERGEHCIVTCSALKRSYRDLLREAGSPVQFVLPHGSRELLAERMAGRSGHFMPVSLLDSQLATLELPQSDESILLLDIVHPPHVLAQQVVDYLTAQSMIAPIETH